MLSNNDFAIGIIVGGSPKHSVIRKGFRYVPMEHESEYKIRLVNRHTTRADATIKIDGRKVGTWRVNPKTSVTIERPDNEHKKFTFFKESTTGAMLSGIVTGASDNGLIEVKFVPESRNVVSTVQQNSFGINNFDEQEMYSSKSIGTKSHKKCAFNESTRNVLGHSEGLIKSEQNFARQWSGVSQQGFSSGGTGLSGYSEQKFGATSAITDIDEEHITDFVIRLVCDNKSSPVRRVVPTPPRIEEVNHIFPTFSPFSSSSRPYPLTDSRFPPSRSSGWRWSGIDIDMDPAMSEMTF